MALAETQQARTIIDRSSSVLLIVPAKPPADAFASMSALHLALSARGTGAADAVSPAHVPTHLQFLPGSSQVQMTPRIQPEIVLDIAGPEHIESAREEQLGGGVRVHIPLPLETEITKEQIELYVRQLPYDAIVILGAYDLEELGEIFTEHADVFYSTPTINIDHRASNEYFGTVNLVDLTASSTAEIVHELIADLHVEIGEEIATALYAGVVAGTQSFQKPSTTPRAFQLAAELLEAGADKDAVIQHLVKTKPLSLLKIAGRVYARLRYDEYGQLYWSPLTGHDFEESGAQREEVPDIMRELLNNISNFNAAFLIYEDSESKYTVYLRLGKGLTKRRSEIRESLNARPHNGALTFRVDATSLEEAERRALEQIRPVLPNL